MGKRWFYAIKSVGALGIFIVIVSLIELAIFKNSENVSIGITTGVIAGFILLIFQMGILEDHDFRKDAVQKISTLKDTKEQESETSVGILNQILNTIKDSSKDNRELTYSNILLSYVAVVIALAALGNEIWTSIGLPLNILWIGTLLLLLGGMIYIYCEFKKIRINLFVTGFFLVMLILIIFFVIQLSTSSTTFLTSSAASNTINNCNECSQQLNSSSFTGYFTLLGAALGAVLGFLLFFIHETVKERKQRKQLRALLIFRLLSVHSTIVAIKAETENLTKIETSDDLKGINNILKKIDLNEEIKEIKKLFEKSVIHDIEDPELFAKFERLRIEIINVVLQTYSNDEDFNLNKDIKPKLTRQLNDIINDIEKISEKILNI